MAASKRESRIAVVDPNRCKPSKCRQECKKSCPVVKTGKRCIEVASTSSIASIAESLCIGCGICVKKCPFKAIKIYNLPSAVESQTVHRYGANTFKLFRLPLPRMGQVLGLVGANGMGKSTILNILSGRLKPNLGNYDVPPDWSTILRHFAGSELQNFFTKSIEGGISVVYKPQAIRGIPKASSGTVGVLILQVDDRGVREEVYDALELHGLLERDLKNLSGGELQRVAIAYAYVQDASVYIFDEPSSFLDIKQRLRAAKLIQSLAGGDRYVIVVEHDLSMLEYLSDYVCVLYGTPGAYGVVTVPFSVREGINIFLDGYIPTENLRFREESLGFKVAEAQDELEDVKVYTNYSYPSMTKTLDGFKLVVEGGTFACSQIVVMLGENGTGKTTLVKLLAGKLEPDDEVDVPQLTVSYKPQKNASTSKLTVRQKLNQLILASLYDPVFISDVLKPLRLEQLMDHELHTLSGGELQRVALCICLGKPADLYLIDEPSADLDAEKRLLVAKVIKRFIFHAKKSAFVVEHDFLMGSYLADRVIVYEGKPSVECTARAPEPAASGINRFLSQLGVTFRRDPENYRPRINKPNSVRDREQKASGSHFVDEPSEHHRRSSARSRRKTSS